MVISCEKMHMISILVRYGFRWHSDKPYRTRLRLVRYGLSECHLNPYRTRMDTICISSLTGGSTKQYSFYFTYKFEPNQICINACLQTNKILYLLFVTFHIFVHFCLRLATYFPLSPIFRHFWKRSTIFAYFCHCSRFPLILGHFSQLLTSSTSF